MGPYGRDRFRVRFDWGQVGTEAIAPGTALVAVVDMLSFTTALTVAADSGIEVFPYRWRDESAVAFARTATTPSWRWAVATSWRRGR
jgi:2-phosphosulfolactate phosphatase